jgi:hypothetical protein
MWWSLPRARDVRRRRSGGEPGVGSSRFWRLVRCGLTRGAIRPRGQRDQRGEPGCHRSGKHGSPVARGSGTLAGPVHGVGDGWQQRGPERRAQLPAGVDHPADQALLSLGAPGAARHHAAERRAGGPEPDEHHGGQHRVVAAARRELGQDREPGSSGKARHNEYPVDSKASCPPGGEHAGGKADDALRCDRQAGGERRKAQDLLQVEGEHEHLPAVPQAQQQHQGAGAAQPAHAQQAGPDERVGAAPLGHRERGDGQGRQPERDQHAGRA